MKYATVLLVLLAGCRVDTPAWKAAQAEQALQPKVGESIVLKPPTWTSEMIDEDLAAERRDREMLRSLYLRAGYTEAEAANRVRYYNAR